MGYHAVADNSNNRIVFVFVHTEQRMVKAPKREKAEESTFVFDVRLFISALQLLS
jgi:hypothetical protein